MKLFAERGSVESNDASELEREREPGEDSDEPFQ